MEQLDKSDGNIYGRKTNINHFASLFESDNDEGTKNRMTPKTTIILLSEDEEGRKEKGQQNKGNEEYEDDREIR